MWPSRCLHAAITGRTCVALTVPTRVCLISQHLAHAVSDDLLEWSDRGPIEIRATQRWLAGRYGAPFVWRQPAAASPLGTVAAEGTADTDETGDTVGGASVSGGAAGAGGGAGGVRGGCFWMVLMGEAELETHASFIGLLRSSDGSTWHLLPERNASRASTGVGEHPQLGAAAMDASYAAGAVEPEGLAVTGASSARHGGPGGGTGVLLTDSGEAKTLVMRRKRVPAMRRDESARRSTPRGVGAKT